MYNITVACGEIQTDGGFEFKLPSDLLNQTLNPDCDQSWYLQDGHLIADPSDPQKLIDPAAAVKSDRLFTSHCVNLKHEIICDSTNRFHFSYVTAFKVRNEAAGTPNSDVNEANLQNTGLLSTNHTLELVSCLYNTTESTLAASAARSRCRRVW
ncbi:hypothetical protein QQF64_025959 [Cirrhinus molitorella]|uniref:Uncharacterized protein n=1 Tax=Cirrhinus molitorella TaxID=172907 RepID=A0ABR3NR78_9TELE